MSETKKAVVSISRGNFENMRCAYGITVEEIAKKANLSVATIRAYSTNDTSYSGKHAREYNEKKMNRVLEELISLKIDSIFDKPTENTSKIQNIDAFTGEKKKPAAGGPGLSDLTRAEVGEAIKKYCKKENMSVSEFCDMCGFSPTYFTPFTIKKSPRISCKVVNRILKATGWTEDDLKNGIKDNVIQKKIEPKQEPVKEEVKKPVQTQTIFNKKLTAENGKYYKEYDIYVLQHKREEIRMEEFIKEAQKC